MPKRRNGNGAMGDYDYFLVSIRIAQLFRVALPLKATQIYKSQADHSRALIQLIVRHYRHPRSWLLSMKMPQLLVRLLLMFSLIPNGRSSWSLVCRN